MKIIILGCGRVGAELAFRLYRQGHQVAVIDQSPAAFNNLHPDFRGRMVEGEGLAQDVLHRAGIEEADGLAAVTNSDTLNVVVGYLAQTVYHVPRAVVRNYNSRWQQLHAAFGLPVVSSTIWGAERIEEMLTCADMPVLFSAGDGEISVYELQLPAAVAGVSLAELLPEERFRVVALTRAGRAMLPDRTFTLAAGDVLYLSARPADMVALREQLNLEPGC
jgi:trk system potassium uptake protein TrkA